MVQIIKNNIPKDAQEALAVYVAYRENVIALFRELLKRDSDDLATEDKVHSLIYLRYEDSEKIEYDSHNLWLLGSVLID